METLERTPPQPQATSPLRALSLAALDWSAIATWLLSALLVVYLGLENGGYGPIPRGQVGVAVWWLVLLGVAVGALRQRDLTKQLEDRVHSRSFSARWTTSRRLVR